MPLHLPLASSSSTTVTLRSPGQEEGDSKEEIPGLNPCGQGGDKDALYRWESMGGSFLTARGRTASGGTFSQTVRLIGL
eukprot:516504-Pelagomonas_calceolata.AAC.1